MRQALFTPLTLTLTVVAFATQTLALLVAKAGELVRVALESPFRVAGMIRGRNRGG